MIQSINNKLLVGIITIIALIIILLSVYYIFFNGAEEVIDEPEIIIQTDDRISPNENQAVILEVLRIRNRDLFDIIMQQGNSWKNKPKMYFITEESVK